MAEESTQAGLEPGQAPRRAGEWLGLAGVMLAAAGLRFTGLQQNGFGNAYYAAAVRSMMGSWHNFWFCSFDPAGFVTVDKPPLALWAQVLSAKLFGFSGLSLMLPQAVEGCLSVLLVYHLVRRRFGAGPGLLAGLAMALMPVAVAVDRFNNVDSCVVLLVLLAAWAFCLAWERGKLGWLLIAAAFAGLGFNAKMMAAFIALPVFYGIYLFFAPLSWAKRLVHLALASLVLALVALSWPLSVDLTPPDQRPYVGSTQDNSMIGLSLGWNGFQRLLTRGHGFRRPGQEGQQPELNQPAVAAQQAGQAEPGQGQWQGRRGRGGFMGTGEPGFLRLANTQMAGQMAWLLPLGLLGLLAGWGRWRRPFTAQQRDLLFWAGWFLIDAGVLSFMRGAMHPYYLVLLAPSAAALFGIGAWQLWLRVKAAPEAKPAWHGWSAFWGDGGLAWALLLPAAILLTALWQDRIVAPSADWALWLRPMLWVGAALSSLALLLALRWTAQKRLAGPGLALGLAALLLCPLAWSLTSLISPARSPEAGPHEQRPSGFSMDMSDAATRKLLGFLSSHPSGCRFVLAAQNVHPVAPIIIQTGQAALAVGGFMGGDPILTVDELAKMAQQHQFRYFMLQQGRGAGRGPGLGAGVAQEGQAAGSGQGGWGMQGLQQQGITQWVRQHGQPVDPALWRAEDTAALEPGAGEPGLDRRGPNGMQLYDLDADQAFQ
jgi:4-amino-4-deoxy-L-arabinose transferase-like glycosyltransferase